MADDDYISADEPVDDAAKDLHAKALKQFDAICTAQQELRAQCLQARRFVTIVGAQWEGIQEPSAVLASSTPHQSRLAETVKTIST